MKKLILVLAAFVIAIGAYAQTDSTNKKMSPPDVDNTRNDLDQNKDVNHHQKVQTDPLIKAKSDGVMMQQGKMMLVRNGEVLVLDSDFTMSNGTRILSDGTWIQKDGTRTMMKEGQHVDMAGNISDINAKKDDIMYFVPDSTLKKSDKK